MKKPTLWSTFGFIIVIACIILKEVYGSWWFYVPVLAIPAIGWYMQSRKK
jgi:hypothetical protein